jgi:putative holliday junction resolvase
MQKLIAVDYGAKRVGIASTDETGEFALPREVYSNDQFLLPKLSEFARKEGIKKIIIGESRNLDGKANPILKHAEEFAAQLATQGFEVVFHPEFYTSMEADRLQGRTDMRDASAAALILKSYIDTHKQ